MKKEGYTDKSQKAMHLNATTVVKENVAQFQLYILSCIYIHIKLLWSPFYKNGRHFKFYRFFFF